MPDVEVVKQWATENNIPGTLTVLCNNPEVKHLILNDMISYGKEFGLKSFEQVGVIAFLATFELKVSLCRFFNGTVTYWTNFNCL